MRSGRAYHSKALWTLQPGNEDAAAEAYLAPEFLSTPGQPREVIADICGEFFHRDQAVMIGIDVAGAGQRVEQDLGKAAMLPFLILTCALVK
jgi:hypothetical protein